MTFSGNDILRICELLEYNIALEAIILGSILGYVFVRNIFK